MNKVVMMLVVVIEMATMVSTMMVEHVRGYRRL
jgi:hypothetical protein